MALNTWSAVSGNRCRRYRNDGTIEMIGPGGRWESRLPNGTTETGTAPNEAAALGALERVHTAYVLAQWDKGQMIAERRFICPLT